MMILKIMNHKPYVEKAIINGKHGYWRLARVLKEPKMLMKV